MRERTAHTQGCRCGHRELVGIQACRGDACELPLQEDANRGEQTRKSREREPPAQEIAHKGSPVRFVGRGHRRFNTFLATRHSLSSLYLTRIRRNGNTERKHAIERDVLQLPTPTHNSVQI